MLRGCAPQTRSNDNTMTLPSRAAVVIEVVNLHTRYITPKPAGEKLTLSLITSDDVHEDRKGCVAYPSATTQSK